MEKEIKGIIDSNDRRYWVDEDDSLTSQYIEYNGCKITRNENGSFNIKNNNDYYKFDIDLYPAGIKSVIY